MNKRQRKKNRTGEFIEYGFEIEARLADPSKFDSIIWDEFIPFIEKNNLGFGGGVDALDTKLVFGFMTARSGPHKQHTCCEAIGRPHGHGLRSCTEEDRLLVLDWFTEHPGVENVMVGSLVDVNR